METLNVSESEKVIPCGCVTVRRESALQLLEPAGWSSSRSESFTDSSDSLSSVRSHDHLGSPSYSSQEFVRILSPSRQKVEPVSKRDLMRALKRIGLPKLRRTKEDKYRRKVLLNGVPLADVDVKRAEEFAGPIHPGNFWYDKQAGFWGVEAGPCLGMIPPFIEQFDQPMSRYCAAGNTGVLVNGRELHYKDLERLSYRGLPKTPGCSYRIWSDGRVVEDSTGKFLTGLGMLAPSLEKTRRGDGLYIPTSYSM